MAKATDDEPATDEDVGALRGDFHAHKVREAGREVWYLTCRSCRLAWTLPAPTGGELADLAAHAAEHREG